MPVDIESWAAQIRAGDVRAISRAITAIEDHDPQSEELLKRIFPHTGDAFVLGVTGAPGTGKSTLVDRLAAHLSPSAETQSELSPSIPPALTQAAQFWAIASGCKDTRATREFLFAPWQREVFSAASRAPRRCRAGSGRGRKEIHPRRNGWRRPGRSGYRASRGLHAGSAGSGPWR